MPTRSRTFYDDECCETLIVETATATTIDVNSDPDTVLVELEEGPQCAADYFGVANSSFTLTRDGNGDVASIAYSNGITLTINRNGNGQVTSITSSDGKTKTILRDGNGVVTGATLS